MGIRRKPKLLIETEGWSKYNECFDGFFLFGLRVALVYFWPEEGHLSWGRLRIFGLRAGRRLYLGYFWPEERLNFFVLRGGRRPTRRTKKFSLSEGQNIPNTAEGRPEGQKFLISRRTNALLKAKNKPKQPEGQNIKSHQNIHCTCPSWSLINSWGFPRIPI